MTAKEYLSQAFYMNRQIKAKERRLEWLTYLCRAQQLDSSWVSFL